MLLYFHRNLVLSLNIYESIGTTEIHKKELPVFFSLSEHDVFGVQIIIGKILEVVIL